MNTRKKYYKTLLFLMFLSSLFGMETSNKNTTILNNKKQIDDSNEMSKTVLSIIDPYISKIDREAQSYNLTQTDKPLEGQEEFLKILQDRIDHNEPLIFSALAFPYKSPNTLKKTLVARADMAERQALLNIQKLMDAIKKVYKPGAVFFIFTDGEPFCDLLNIPYKDVSKYESDLKKLSADCPNIRIITLSDLLPGTHQERLASITQFRVLTQPLPAEAGRLII